MAKRVPFNKGRKCVRKKRVPGVGLRCASYGAKKKRKAKKGPAYAKTRRMSATRTAQRASTSSWRRDFDLSVDRGERESAKTQMMGARRRRG